MIRALENNTLGIVLASISGALLLGCLGLMLIWAMPAGTSADGEDSEDDGSPASVASIQSIGPLEEFAIVSERPVFNEDRRPAPVLGEGEGDPEDEIPEVIVGAPEVTLAGIIITPTSRMATLKSPDHPQSLVAYEGQPLKGDFGSWQVSKIEARMVTLSSDEGEEMQLELQVHDAMIDEPPEVTRKEEEAEPGTATEEVVAQNDAAQDTEPLSRADQIRQRIEERREELRRAAEEADEGQAENYRSAIQNMIQQSRDDVRELAAEREKELEEQRAREDGQ